MRRAIGQGGKRETIRGDRCRLLSNSSGPGRDEPPPSSDRGERDDGVLYDRRADEHAAAVDPGTADDGAACDDDGEDGDDGGEWGGGDVVRRAVGPKPPEGVGPNPRSAGGAEEVRVSFRTCGADGGCATVIEVATVGGEDGGPAARDTAVHTAVAGAAAAIGPPPPFEPSSSSAVPACGAERSEGRRRGARNPPLPGGRSRPPIRSATGGSRGSSPPCGPIRRRRCGGCSAARDSRAPLRALPPPRRGPGKAGRWRTVGGRSVGWLWRGVLVGV